MNKILLLLLASCSLSSHAQYGSPTYQFPYQYPYPYYNRCYYSDSVTLIASKPSAAGPCIRIEPTLQRVTHHFPVMGTLTVNAWVGGYSRSATVTNTYRIDRVDPCSGRFISSETYTDTESKVYEYNVDNPNLHASVQQSFIANAPMTDQEAQAAMSTALNKCQRFK